MVWHASRFDSFIPRWQNQNCASLLSSSSIYFWLASNVYESDTSGSQLKVHFAVMHHIWWVTLVNHKTESITRNQRSTSLAVHAQAIWWEKKLVLWEVYTKEITGMVVLDLPCSSLCGFIWWKCIPVFGFGHLMLGHMATWLVDHVQTADVFWLLTIGITICALC